MSASDETNKLEGNEEADTPARKRASTENGVGDRIPFVDVPRWKHTGDKHSRKTLQGYFERILGKAYAN